MRTYDQLLADLKVCKELGLPFKLSAEEKAKAFGDIEWSLRSTTARIEEMCRRYKERLPLSKSDIKEVKQFLKGKL